MIFPSFFIFLEKGKHSRFCSSYCTRLPLFAHISRFLDFSHYSKLHLFYSYCISRFVDFAHDSKLPMFTHMSSLIDFAHDADSPMFNRITWLQNNFFYIFLGLIYLARNTRLPLFTPMSGLIMTGCLYLLLLPSWLSLLVKLFLFIHISGLYDNLFPGWLTLLTIPLCLSLYLFIFRGWLTLLSQFTHMYIFPDWLTLHTIPSCLYSIYSYFGIDWFCS